MRSQRKKKCVHGPRVGSKFRASLINAWTIFILHVWSRDSAVGTATGYGLEGRGIGVRVPIESRLFSFPRRPDWFYGPTGTSGYFLGSKSVAA
jgi:hypothetical protein